MVFYINYSSNEYFVLTEVTWNIENTVLPIKITIIFFIYE